MKTLLAAAVLLAAAQDKKIDWKTDYKAALAEAKKAGRLVVVHFWGDD
jgi:hypothetical protein